MRKRKPHPYVFAGLNSQEQKILRALLYIDRDELHIIADVYCEEFGVTPAQFKGSRRHAHESDARKVFCYLCREELYSFTYKRLGMYMKKDHSSIIHNVKQCGRLLETDPEFRVKYINIRHRARQLLHRNGIPFNGSKIPA